MKSKRTAKLKAPRRVVLHAVVRARRVEVNHCYAIRIRKGRWPAFLARRNASAPNLFWFHEDAVAYLEKLRKGKPSCDCHKRIPERCDIVKVFVRWTINGKTYNTPGDMFRSGEELKRKRL